MNQQNIITISTILIIGILLVAIFPAQVQSNNYSNSTSIQYEEAIIAAEQFLILKEQNQDFSIETYEPLYDISNNNKLAYIFHLSPIGYIIVPSSIYIMPVLAYSFTSNAPMMNQINPLQSLLTPDISSQLKQSDLIPHGIKEKHHNNWEKLLENTIEISAYTEFEQWPPEGSTNTEGWIETQWSQDPPYNNFCPMDTTTSVRSIAGCPSITMGQILYYHRTINNVQFNDSDDYNHRFLDSFRIDDDYDEYDFPSFPTLNTYLNIVEDHFQNEIQLTDEDIAAIVFACGVAAEQVYSSQVSGTYGVHQAQDAYQRFQCNNASLYYKPDNTIFDKIIDNIKQALPVHFAVVTPAWDSGHNLIIDGYNTDNYYHLNFGWGGTYDGWYYIPDNMPYELTVIEGVIVDILKTSSLEDLSVNGALSWQDKTGGETVKGNFTVENIGAEDSLLSWEIVSIPEWGEWTLTPSNGNNIKTTDEEVTIQVSCILPAGRGKTFSGSITVINSNNPTDREFIPISLSLPKQKNSFFINNIWDFFPYLHYFFGLILQNNLFLW